MEADLSGARWRKSSHSGGGNDCVEVAFVDGGAAVRDSKDPEGGAFRLPASGWRGLLAAVRTGGHTHD
ncbi:MULTISPECIES: DUF397 domain-containing protein [unclassified Amycolatopsis]|uniref:DUF397 domain-containing protein n=1 Tax=unclassified Amycolatopsis TaxID=2618356 RepID=UPI001FF55AF8|nr:DUF397 domain-containing protein [Amycolatopsis sp. FBCC-B4732]UOX84897.1 DUF397 domain-containing protein [Amycolatopsis sp. FBCC-B4732]